MKCLTKIIALVLLLASSLLAWAAAPGGAGQRQILSEGWRLRSSVLVPEGGERVSAVGYKVADWFKIAVPTTVLNALVKNGVYSDPRIGLNTFQVPDSSDAFNIKHDLAKFSYLPDKRNPWRDPYWYRTEFTLRATPPNTRVWLNFSCINYRAEVWLNGAMIADRERMAGMFQRFRYDVTARVRTGRNALAVKIYPVDHPGEPDAQLVVFGRPRGEQKEIVRDVTMIESAGYDCMMTIPDRNMGIPQEVFIDWTGPVDIRYPFVTTTLPLPDTSRATLGISAELFNAGAAPVRGVLRGRVAGSAVTFTQPVELAPGETRLVQVTPEPVLDHPRLWWPVNYGAQPLYDLVLRFESERGVTERRVQFGVRQITTQMHELDGWHGRRILVNGQKIFCRGGYIQPELLFDWDARRIENEIRYFVNANLNLIYFEDIPNPPDDFLEICDRLGLLFGNCFYSCYWVTEPGKPDDVGLLERCTVDVLKRYRNHPSLLMYMAMDEGLARRDVYEMWRRHVAELDGTRFWIPSASFTDTRPNIPAYFKSDLPTGMNDLDKKSYTWKEPETYFHWVREDRSWMFKMESGSASLPPISSLAKFLPGLGRRGGEGAPFPLDAAWAHHGANSYYTDYDRALRRLHGEPESVADYCWKGHLLTADQHRSFYEAVNHRMWDVTSGFTEWKINSCYPDVQWQIFDYYHKPAVSYFFIKRACEPLHVQMDLIDHAVSVINCRLAPQEGLQVTARVFDLDARPLWQRNVRLSVPANAYREAFAIPNLTALAPFVFVKLELKDAAGRPVSDNFYWLRGQGTADYQPLQKLPLAPVDAAMKNEERDGETRVRVNVANPGRHVAFFVQLALTQGPGGAEILPVLWEDNYFSLLPGEKREITARFAARDLGGKRPVLEVGGWNVLSAWRCVELIPSKPVVKAGEPFTLTARIADTFLDASRVELKIDGRPAATRWAWARGAKTDEVKFPLKISQSGRHRLTVGRRGVDVTVD